MKRVAAIGAAILVIFAGLVAGGLMIAHSKPEPVTPTPVAVQTAPTVQELWQATNQERQKAGLPPLVLDERLNASAQAKCNDEVKRSYYAHNTPDGHPFTDFITAQDPNYHLGGENLAYGHYTTKSVIAAWMASPTHRGNILNTDYTNIGFGICNDKLGYKIVQHFVQQ